MDYLEKVRAQAQGVLQRFDLQGKVAVVVGGNKGLGQAMTLALASAGEVYSGTCGRWLQSSCSRKKEPQIDLYIVWGRLPRKLATNLRQNLRQSRELTYDTTCYSRLKKLDAAILQF